MKKPLVLIFSVFFLFLITLPISNTIHAAPDSNDLTKIAEDYKKRAEAGDAKAQSQLGYLYYVGEGVPQDYAMAVDWYRKAAVQGDKDAQYNLAVAYAFGEGTKQDYKEAVIWYRRAAEQGHAIAQYSLGISYIYGEGVEQNESEGAVWFKKSAEQGYERAQVFLGSMYHTGDGVPKDVEKAVYWYRKAADRGNAAAQYNLGTLYRAGKGVEQDYNQALRWFRLSADQGYAAAYNELESMERANAGAHRKKSAPVTRPVLTTEPVTEEQSPAESVVTTAPETGSPGTNVPLVKLQKEDLLTLDSTAAEIPTDVDATASVTAVDGSIDSVQTDRKSGETSADPFSETNIGNSEITITEEQTEPEPGDDVVETSGEQPADGGGGISEFFGKLFGSGNETVQHAEEVVSVEEVEIITPYKPSGKIATADQEVDTEIIEETTVQEQKSTVRINPERPEVHSTVSDLWARPSIQQPATVHSGISSAPDIPEEKISVTETIEFETTPIPPENDPEIKVTAAKQEIDGLAEENTKEVTATVFEKEEIKTPDQTLDKNTIEQNELKSQEEISIADTDEQLEDSSGSGGIFGFFGRLFGSDDSNKPSEATEESREETPDVKVVDKSMQLEKIQESTAVSFAAGDAPAEHQLTTVQEDTVAMVDENESIQANFAPVDIPVQDSQREDTDEKINEPNDDTMVLSIEEDIDDSQELERNEPMPDGNEESEGLFGFFGDFFSGDSEKDVTEQSPVESDKLSMEDNQPIVQAMVESEPEMTPEATAEEALMATPSEINEESQSQSIYSDMSYESLQTFAVKGETDAQYQLATMYYEGKEVDKNYSQAFLWYRRAGLQGHMEAQYSLGNMYLMGEGISPNDEEARNWYKMAADQGHIAAKNNYESLLRVADDTDPANTEQDNQQQPHEKVTDNNVESKGKKGFFSNLFGSDENEDEEIQTVKTSPDESTSESTEQTFDNEAPAESINEVSGKSDYELGVAYAYGEGVTQNHATAFTFFQKAAEQGYAPAEYKLGVAYAYGEGVKQNLELAAEWYKKAAEQGYTIAQRNLGGLYMKGHGIEQNKPLALAWYNILAEQGNVMDIHRRDALEKEMKESEIEEAERLQQQLKASLKTASTSF